jgi:DNA-binding transcriptional regulator YdaS (Cro superfamily)
MPTQAGYFCVMTPPDLISHFGTQQLAASAIGVTQGAVSQWVIAGSIPYLRQLAIEIATNRTLKASMAHAPEHERRKVLA